jgi:hypothetical protein
VTSTHVMALLIGIGGTLQIAGVLLVIREIAADRKQAAVVLSPLVETEHQPSYAPGLTDRDKRILDFRHQLLEETVRTTRAETRAWIEEIDLAFREFIREQLTGDIGTRIWGVRLILLGLVCATGGGVWATLSTEP